MKKVRIAIVGVGNCSSSLIQGIHYYQDKSAESANGLIHWKIGDYGPSDIDVVAAFDIDQRKVGKDVSEAIFSKPNCTTVFHGDVPHIGVTVQMGCILDGFADHMRDHPEERAFVISSAPEATEEDVVSALIESGADILVNFLPVGSEKATRFYATCAIKAGVSFVNNIPVFIASDPVWANRFAERGLVIIGDDIKSQVGATIVHRTLTDLFAKRGCAIDHTYQLNTGGNTDFMNMLNRTRLHSKKVSKTEAVQSVAATRFADEDIHVGPSDYIPWQNDNKLCFLRIEGRLFGDVPMNIELRLSVEDSPNSAGVSIDSIRCAKLAMDRGERGVLIGPSSYFCKHPPEQFSDDECFRLVEAFLSAPAREDVPVPALGE